MEIDRLTYAFVDEIAYRYCQCVGIFEIAGMRRLNRTLLARIDRALDLMRHTGDDLRILLPHMCGRIHIFMHSRIRNPAMVWLYHRAAIDAACDLGRYDVFAPFRILLYNSIAYGDHYMHEYITAKYYHIFERIPNHLRISHVFPEEIPVSREIFVRRTIFNVVGTFIRFPDMIARIANINTSVIPRIGDGNTYMKYRLLTAALQDRLSDSSYVANVGLPPDDIIIEFSIGLHRARYINLLDFGMSAVDAVPAPLWLGEFQISVNSAPGIRLYTRLLEFEDDAERRLDILNIMLDYIPPQNIEAIPLRPGDRELLHSAIGCRNNIS